MKVPVTRMESRKPDFESDIEDDCNNESIDSIFQCYEFDYTKGKVR